MKNITVLDCTLRDGGYVNNWKFGKKTITEVAKNVALSGVDIFEVSFMRDDKYDIDRCVFQDVETISSLIPKVEGVKYAAMIETGNLLPIDKISTRQNNYIDIIRFVTWKNKVKEAYDYCKELKYRGYEICVQPTRTDQYTIDEFKKLINTFNDIEPSAFYIVDTFGVMSKKILLEYVKAADEELSSDVAIGYHGHNNFQQVVGNAETFIEFPTKHKKYIDASILGIGRGAGNLPLEILYRYLNDFWGGSYNIDVIMDVAHKYINTIYDETPWGYNMPFFISANHGANPNYAIECSKRGMSNIEISEFLSSLDEFEKIRFSEDNIIRFLRDRL